METDNTNKGDLIMRYVDEQTRFVNSPSFLKSLKHNLRDISNENDINEPPVKVRTVENERKEGGVIPKRNSICNKENTNNIQQLAKSNALKELQSVCCQYNSISSICTTRLTRKPGIFANVLCSDQIQGNNLREPTNEVPAPPNTAETTQIQSNANDTVWSGENATTTCTANMVVEHKLIADEVLRPLQLPESESAVRRIKADLRAMYQNTLRYLEGKQQEDEVREYDGNERYQFSQVANSCDSDRKSFPYINANRIQDSDIEISCFPENNPEIRKSSDETFGSNNLGANCDFISPVDPCYTLDFSLDDFLENIPADMLDLFPESPKEVEGKDESYTSSYLGEDNGDAVCDNSFRSFNLPF